VPLAASALVAAASTESGATGQRVPRHSSPAQTQTFKNAKKEKCSKNISPIIVLENKCQQKVIMILFCHPL
jgi:hypothetical protein